MSQTFEEKSPTLYFGRIYHKISAGVYRLVAIDVPSLRFAYLPLA